MCDANNNTTWCKKMKCALDYGCSRKGNCVLINPKTWQSSAWDKTGCIQDQYKMASASSAVAVNNPNKLDDYLFTNINYTDSVPDAPEDKYWSEKVITVDDEWLKDKAIKIRAKIKVLEGTDVDWDNEKWPREKKRDGGREVPGAKIINKYFARMDPTKKGKSLKAWSSYIQPKKPHFINYTDHSKNWNCVPDTSIPCINAQDCEKTNPFPGTNCQWACVTSGGSGTCHAFPGKIVDLTTARDYYDDGKSKWCEGVSSDCNDGLSKINELICFVSLKNISFGETLCENLNTKVFLFDTNKEVLKLILNEIKDDDWVRTGSKDIGDDQAFSNALYVLWSKIKETRDWWGLGWPNLVLSQSIKAWQGYEMAKEVKVELEKFNEEKKELIDQIYWTGGMVPENLNKTIQMYNSVKGKNIQNLERTKQKLSHPADIVIVFSDDTNIGNDVKTKFLGLSLKATFTKKVIDKNTSTFDLRNIGISTLEHNHNIKLRHTGFLPSEEVGDRNKRLGDELVIFLYENWEKKNMKNYDKLLIDFYRLGTDDIPYYLVIAAQDDIYIGNTTKFKALLDISNVQGVKFYNGSIPSNQDNWTEQPLLINKETWSIQLELHNTVTKKNWVTTLTFRFKMSSGKFGSLKLNVDAPYKDVLQVVAGVDIDDDDDEAPSGGRFSFNPRRYYTYDDENILTDISQKTWKILNEQEQCMKEQCQLECGEDVCPY